MAWWKIKNNESLIDETMMISHERRKIINEIRFQIDKQPFCTGFKNINDLFEFFKIILIKR